MAKKALSIPVAMVMFAALTLSLNAQPVSLLSEEFEESFPPAGWSTSTSIGQNQWLRNDYWGRPNYTPGGNGYCADNDDDGAGPGAARVGNNILQSPTFDASGYQTIWLAYDVDWYPQGLGMLGRVEVYNGSSWIPVMSHPMMGRKTTRDSINISTHVAGVMNARVRFLYTELTGGVKSNWYEVDDVNVWGSDPPEPLDLVMVEIIRPKNWEQGGVPFEPSCRIYNNLDTTAHGKVLCRIREWLSQETVYEDVHNNYPLNPGYTVVGFKAFLPLPNSLYNAFFVVEHPNDTDPTNNHMDKNFTTSESDVTPYEMLAPETPDQVDPFEPSANFAERANRLTPNVTMRCQIMNIEDEEVVYKDSIAPCTFEVYDTVLAVFDTAALANGTYEIRFWATDEDLFNISNPPLVDTFNYTTGIAEAPITSRFSLDAVTPNPCADFTAIRFTLGHTTNVTLRVYDAAGNVAATLADGSRNAGCHSVKWNTHDVASGIYFLKLTTPEFRATQKLLVLH
ncbi:MAG: T9SS type A sorting domain-containing protein [candidate division WOR-3 bacterium]|nr:T9SS type A sorting domain-containing protein [candidate division WOR-3 bacterium]